MEFSNKAANLLLGFRFVRDEGDQEPLDSMCKIVLQITRLASLEGLLLTLMNSFDTMMSENSLWPFRGFRFDRMTLGNIFKVGSGTILESVCMRIGFLLNGKLIAGVGTAAFAASQIVGWLSSLTFCLGDGVSSACTSLVGQSLNASMKQKAKDYVRVGKRISIFMSP